MDCVETQHVTLLRIDQEKRSLSGLMRPETDTLYVLKTSKSTHEIGKPTLKTMMFLRIGQVRPFFDNLFKRGKPKRIQTTSQFLIHTTNFRETNITKNSRVLASKFVKTVLIITFFDSFNAVKNGEFGLSDTPPPHEWFLC